MTKEELLQLYIKQITNYGTTYEEFKTIAVNQDPNFPGIAEFLNEDLYSYEEFLESPDVETEVQTEIQPPTDSQPTVEAQNDNSTINTTATISSY